MFNKSLATNSYMYKWQWFCNGNNKQLEAGRDLIHSFFWDNKKGVKPSQRECFVQRLWSWICMCFPVTEVQVKKIFENSEKMKHF